MRNLESFKDINDGMYWKESALKQVDDFRALSERLGLHPYVVNYHTSKSIDLPVVEFVVNGVLFFLRDNFHDVNVCVRSEVPIMLSYADLLGGVCPEHDWIWYLGEIDRCRGYRWQYFTDEEMDDPQVLCVKTPSPRSGDMLEWKVYPEQKTLWFKRMTDPEWWSKDWSDGTLCWNGEFGPGVKIFVQNHPYLQGISVLVPKESKEFYQPGKSEFAFAVGDLEAAELVIRRIIIATK